MKFLGMQSHHKEVIEVLAALNKKLTQHQVLSSSPATTAAAFTAKGIGMALFGLQSMSTTTTTSNKKQNDNLNITSKSNTNTANTNTNAIDSELSTTKLITNLTKPVSNPNKPTAATPVDADYSLSVLLRTLDLLADKAEASEEIMRPVDIANAIFGECMSVLTIYTCHTYVIAVVVLVV